jgi:3-dehydroquinate synthase
VSPLASNEQQIPTFAQADAGAVRVEVPGSAPWSYEVVVGAGVLAELPRRLASLGRWHRVALIADETVARLHAPAVLERLAGAGQTAELFTFPAGEAEKTRERWAELSDAMLAAGLGRDAVVLALGGGVTGDLAGFVAATYMRGLPVVQLPTTLLAMIDSSVGGKTGVDTAAGKNLIGAFHPPRLVLADTATLRTLPPEHLRAGLAEALKHAAIADVEYGAWIDRHAASLLAGDAPALTHLITRSVEIKAGFVAADEREAGPRKLLNFGHTLGHAVEALSGYRLLHGEAVAIGMALEAELGERLGVTAPGTAARLKEMLLTLELPISLPEGMRYDDVVAATRTDKKARAGHVEYALLERFGTGVWGVRGE